MVDDLAQTIRENPSLKVLSANGYFDLATPFYGAERDLNQMELDSSQGWALGRESGGALCASHRPGE